MIEDTPFNLTNLFIFIGFVLNSKYFLNTNKLFSVNLRSRKEFSFSSRLIFILRFTDKNKIRSAIES